MLHQLVLIASSFWIQITLATNERRENNGRGSKPKEGGRDICSKVIC